QGVILRPLSLIRLSHIENEIGMKINKIKFKYIIRGSDEMTDLCPKCGKKAEDGEKVCPICGEEMTSISQDNDNDKKERGKNRINLFRNIIISVVVLVVLFVNCTVVARYFNAGKNIANTINTQKSELKILKKTSKKQYEVSGEAATEKDDEEGNDKSEAEGEKKAEEEIKRNENLGLQKKDKYLSMMDELDKEAIELADEELNGNQEKLLNYTSKIYKKYDTLLNMIYSDISAALENGELEELKNDEIDWINKKDEMASYAVGSEDTSESDENWAYFDSLATSTKDRCYYLIHKYMH
ncbi:MAG: zinc-ribbon domain-containing protein, partial [Peptacetobacter hiranonis]|nr:zinc-ribbon domain-containing protein [Peptacetobacter hiranonis]